MIRIICVLIGYVFGLLQTGYLYGRLHNIDIRKHGSGNAGTTNALRTLGPKAGLVTLLGDVLKCVVAVVVVNLLFGKSQEQIMPMLSMYTGMGVVLGHNYPVQMGFKGGKGIAATAGLLLSTADPRLTILAFSAFALIVLFTRYVSVGSLVVCTIYLIGTVYLGQKGFFSVPAGCLKEMYGIAAFLLISAVFKHRSNIDRLLHGTENKISFHKK